jgi:hypothetical protein
VPKAATELVKNHKGTLYEVGSGEAGADAKTTAIEAATTLKLSRQQTSFIYTNRSTLKDESRIFGHCPHRSRGSASYGQKRPFQAPKLPTAIPVTPWQRRRKYIFELAI